MSTLANWIGTGAHGALSLAVFFLLRPASREFEGWLAWFGLTFGYTAYVVTFVTQALKIGRLPLPPASTATNWVRYVGTGLGTLGLLGSFVALTRGGVRQVVFTLIAVAGYYALFTFAALNFGTEEVVIAYFVIGCVIFVAAIMIYYGQGEYGKRNLACWIAWVSWIIEAGFIVMAGIELFKRSVAGNDAEDWAFAGISILQGAWHLIVYLGSVRGLALFSMVETTRNTNVVPSASYTSAAYTRQSYSDF